MLTFFLLLEFLLFMADECGLPFDSMLLVFVSFIFILLGEFDLDHLGDRSEVPVMSEAILLKRPIFFTF